MATKNNSQEPEINVGEAISQTEQFFDKYKKVIIYSLSALVVIIALGLLYKQFVMIPKEKEAVNQTFKAEQYFRNNEFEMALNGDGNAYGFKQIIDEYGAKAGDAVYFYAGVCELQLGNYKDAMGYLKKYNGTDPIIYARALACIGDAHSGMGEYKEAAAEYEKAAAHADNVLAAGYLLKAGTVYEELGENAKALKMYEQIRDKYPQSYESFDISKYITRLQNK